MKIEKEIKEQLKQKRLNGLKQRYFDLEMDIISLEAAGDNKRAEEVRQQLNSVKLAYDAISAIDTTK